jgi:hypothetical protein
VIGQIAIHHRERSWSKRWIAYCDVHAIPYKIVNCLDSDIIQQLRSFDGLLEDLPDANAREQLVARHVIRVAESMGLTVFPSTGSHSRLL